MHKNNGEFILWRSSNMVFHRMFRDLVLQICKALYGLAAVDEIYTNPKSTNYC